MDEKIENINIGLKRFPENIVLNNMMAYLMLEKEILVTKIILTLI